MLGCLDFSLLKRRDKAMKFSRCTYVLSVGAGIAMSPRKRMFLRLSVSAQRSAACIVVVPDFVSSSDKLIWIQTVSYTHLTLPTILRV